MKEAVSVYNFFGTIAEDSSADLFLWDNTRLNDFEKQHSHPFNEILIFKKGGGSHIISNKKYEINDYSFHILPSYFTHQLLRDKYSEGFTIVFSTSFISELQRFDKNMDYSFFISSPSVVCFDEELFKEFNLYFDELIKYRGNKDYFLNLLAVFFYKILINRRDNLKSPAHGFQHKILALIEKHCTEKPDIAFYSQKMNITNCTLSRKVKSSFGKTIMDIQNEKIIERAKKLLLLRDHSVKEVSYYFNFVDESHFCNFFKKHTGFTPKEFLKKSIIYNFLIRICSFVDFV